MSSTTGKIVTWTAPDRAQDVNISANDGNCYASIDFTVVEPSGGREVQQPGTGIWHVHDTASVGFKGIGFLQPTNVSFINIQFREDGGVAEGTGYLAGLTGKVHPTGSWVPVTDGTNDTSGSMITGSDTVSIGPGYPPYGSGGTVTWPIEWQFKVGNGAAKTFMTMTYSASVDSNGNTTESKGGTNVSKNYADPDSTY